MTVTKNPAATDVQVSAEASPAPSLLGTWSTQSLTIEVNTPTTLTVRTTEPITALPAQFLRIRVTR